MRRTTAGEKGEEETGERGEPVAVEGRGNSTSYYSVDTTSGLRSRHWRIIISVSLFSLLRITLFFAALPDRPLLPQS